MKKTNRRSVQTIKTFGAVFLFSILSSMAVFAAESKGLQKIEKVQPPRKLYHWTSAFWLQDWAKAIEADPKNGILSNDLKKGSKFGAMLRASFKQVDKKPALFAWDHPTGGMSNMVSLYPEKTHPDEVLYSLLGQQGYDVSNPETVEAYKKQNASSLEMLKHMSVSGMNAGPGYTRLVDMDIDPNARAIRIVVNPVSGFPEQNYIPEILPELTNGQAQLVLFELGKDFREWVVLDPKVIRRFNADPTYQTHILSAELLPLHLGQLPAPHRMHIESSFMTTAQGKKEALYALAFLLQNSSTISKNTPMVFRNPPLSRTINESQPCDTILTNRKWWNPRTWFKLKK